MTLIRLFHACASLLAVCTLCACSQNEDSDKYRSICPQIQDITVLKQGDSIRYTALQGERGRLLNKTIYVWEIAGIDTITQQAIYNGNDPTVTVYSPNGMTSNMVQLRATYSLSGQQSPLPKANLFVSGFSVSYQGSALEYQLIATKRL